MRISKIEAKNYRCFGPDGVQVVLPFGLVSLVGENNVGKSTLIDVVSKLLNNPHNTSVHPTDSYSIDATTPPTVRVECEFTDAEIKEVIEQWLAPNLQGTSIGHAEVERFIDLYGRTLAVVRSVNDVGTYVASVEWGPFKTDGQQLQRIEGGNGTLSTGAFLAFLQGNEAYDQQASEAAVIELKTSVDSPMFSITARRLRILSDVRSRPSGQGPSGADVNRSLDGTSTADLLMNLKIGDDSQRKLFAEIQESFARFYPDLRVEVTGRQGGVAQVVFTQHPFEGDLPQSSVGTGVVEILTLITNLVGVSNSVIVVEEPELHLHRMSRVALMRLIKSSSEDNQIILITHSTEFVDYQNPSGIIRFSKRSGGAHVNPLPVGKTPQAIEALVDALSLHGASDLVFARAAILVEGATETEFFKALGPRIDKDLEMHNVAVVNMEGDTRFGSYILICDALDMPVICLKDLPGKANRGSNASKFVVLGNEIEKYWKDNGLGELLKKGKAAVGSKHENKPRLGRYMGQHIDPDSVPELLVQVMEEAISAASTR